MKKILIAAIAAAAFSQARADAAEDTLLSAQTAYRAALDAQNTNNGKLIDMQRDLEDAQARLKKAQDDIVRLQSSIQAASAVKTQQASVLRQAGQQLDAAWNAVYGPGGTKARQ